MNKDISKHRQTERQHLTAAQKKCGHSASAFAKAVDPAKEVYFRFANV